MCESGGGSRISQIVGRHVHSLDRGNRSLLSGGNSLLKGTKICSQGGLVTDGGGDTSEKSGHLRASLSESENVIDEEQHVLAFLVSEVLSDGESGKTDSGSGTWGFVHLTVDQSTSGACISEFYNT